MNVSAVRGYCAANRYNFKGENSKEKNEYYNPVNPKTEKKLAMLTSAGTAAVIGTLCTGAVSVLTAQKPLKKVPLFAGLAGALASLAFMLPSKLYHTNVNATVKQKEMDVFTADRELKKDLTRDVHEEVRDPEVSLDKKLDDNLKLQLANKASAVGFTTF